MKHRLSERQRKFCEHYMELGNATKAAVAAGFSVKYAPLALHQPAVQEHLAQLRNSMPAAHSEILNFLTGVMRGNIKTSALRTEAAYQMGLRAGLWKNHKAYNDMIKEAATHE